MGVEIIKDEALDFLQKAQGAMTPPGINNMLKEIQAQAIADNIRLFTKESYAEENGKVTKWDKFKDSTLFYRRKKDNGKIWKKRPSGAKYSPSSKLVQDTGNIRTSIGSTGAKGVNKTTSKYTEYGTAVSYAEAQDKMRPLLGISNATWKKIKNIIYRIMGVN